MLRVSSRVEAYVPLCDFNFNLSLRRFSMNVRTPIKEKPREIVCADEFVFVSTDRRGIGEKSLPIDVSRFLRLIARSSVSWIFHLVLSALSLLSLINFREHSGFSLYKYRIINCNTVKRGGGSS